MLVIVIIFLLITMNRQQQNNMIKHRLFDSLPGRLYVCDPFGHVLFNNGKKINRIADISELDTELVFNRIYLLLQMESHAPQVYTEGRQIQIFQRINLPYRQNAFISIYLQNIPSVFCQKDDIVKIQAHCDKVLSTISEAYLEVDAKGKIYSSNNTLGFFTGAYPSVLKGQSAQTALKEILPEEVYNSLLNNRNSVQDHCYLTTPEKKQIPVEYRIKQMFTEDNEYSGAVLIFTNYMEIAELNREINRHKQLFELLVQKAKICYFHSNSGFDDIIPGPGFSNIWPIYGNSPISIDEWMCTEDMISYTEKRKNLISGKTDHLSLKVRSQYYGDIRCFHIEIVKLEYPVLDRQYFGFIQDVTEYEQNANEFLLNASIFESFFNELPIPLYIKDVTNNFRFLFANKAYLELFDITAEQLIGQINEKVFPEDLAARLSYIDQESNITQNPFQHQEQFIIKNQTFTLNNIIVYKTSIDSRRLFFGTCLDVTEQENIRKKVELQKSLFYSILDKMPILVAAKDARNALRYRIWNKDAEEKSGVSREEILGKNDFEIMHNVTIAEQFQHEDKRALLAGDQTSTRKTIKFREKSFIMDTYTFVVQPDGDNQLVVTIAVDVSENMRLTMEKERVIQDLNALNRKELFIKSCIYQLTKEVNNENNMVNNENDTVTLFKILGNYFMADRCYRFDRSADRLYYYNTGEWNRPEILSLRESQQYFRSSDYPNLFKTLCQKKYIYISDTDILPDNLLEVSELFREQEIKTILIIGIIHNAELCAFIGLDYIQSKKPINELMLNCLIDFSSILQLYETCIANRDDNNDHIHRQKIPMLQENESGSVSSASAIDSEEDLNPLPMFSKAEDKETKDKETK